MDIQNYIGWDIGGAHLKVACVNSLGKLEYVEQFATPLWQGLQQLEDSFPVVLNKLPVGTQSHCLTMTAELVDIFTSRQEGISSLINLCENKLGKNINLYASEHGFVNSNSVIERINDIASANWHASATFTANKVSNGLFIDIGSTTTDIIPLVNRVVVNRGNDDQSRMHFDELVYTGVIRTPLMALSNRVPFNGNWQTLAAEYFSTTADIYRILGLIDIEDDQMATADGKGKDIESSIRRLARMLGTDVISAKEKNNWIQVANYFSEIQLQNLTNSILGIFSYAPEAREQIIGAGVGSFLIKIIAERLNIPYMDFSELFDSQTKLQHKCNVCAPAISLALLHQQSVSR